MNERTNEIINEEQVSVAEISRLGQWVECSVLVSAPWIALWVLAMSFRLNVFLLKTYLVQPVLA